MPPPIDFIEDWSNFLRRVSIFSDLEDDSLRKVAGKLKTLSLQKGTVLYHEGDPGDALYVIQTGRVRIVTHGEEGQEKVLNYLGRGDTFGETALLTGAPRSVTVKIDSNANLLALYKQDFEDFLKTNPTASFYLSRLLSQRLLAAAHPSLKSALAPEVLGFFCDIEKEDHIVFITNLALALVEQTRRKTILMDLSPYSEDLLKSMGFTNPPQTKLLSSEDLQDPEIIETFTLFHPSGLEIIVLPTELFSDDLFQSILPFLETLRQTYQYVLLSVRGRKETDEPFLNRKAEIIRSFLSECDSIFYASGGDPTNLQFLYSLPAEKQTAKKIILGEKYASLFFPVHFTIPWKDSTSLDFKRGGHPYLNRPEHDPIQRILNRIARSIGKMQVGLAMGSGAAYGYSLIGILRVLEREKIPIDFVAGTSMGALIAAFYASGKTVAEIETIAHAITKIWLRRNFLSDLNLPWPHGGLLLGQTISRFLKSVLGEKDFKDMQIPFACVATDIMTGDGVVLRDGKVWEAVRASLSLPLIFCPYKLQGRFFVDGGLVNPVPTSVIASMGADTLISVNLTSKVSEKKVSLKRLGMFPSKTPGIFDIFFKMVYTMEYQVASAKVDLSHVVIRPDTRNFSWIDFHKSKQIIPLGEEAAEEALTKIKSRLPFFSDYCRVNLRFLR